MFTLFANQYILMSAAQMIGVKLVHKTVVEGFNHYVLSLHFFI